MKRLLTVGIVIALVSACATSPRTQSRSTASAQRASSVEVVSIYAENTDVVIRGLERSDVVFDDGYSSLERDDGEIELTVEDRDEFRVGVPYGTAVSVENENGSVVVAGTRGDLEADLENSSIFVYDPGANVEISTTNAPVLLVKRMGRIEEYSVATTNAEVNAGVPEGNLNVRLETSEGYFRINNLPLTVLTRGEEELEGYIGSEDAGRLEISSSNGTITLQPAAAYARAAVAARSSAAASSRSGSSRDGVFGNISESISDTLADLGIISRRRSTGTSTTSSRTSRADDSDDEEAAAGGAAAGAAGAAAVPEDIPEDVAPRRTVVFPFEEINTAARGNGLGAALSEMLITAIANSPAVTVIERSQIDTMLEETKFQLSGVTTTEESIQIGNVLNAEIIILGSVSRFGGRIELDVRVIRLETGEVLFTQYGSAADAEVRNMVNTLGEEISVAIAQIPPRRQTRAGRDTEAEAEDGE